MKHIYLRSFVRFSLQSWVYVLTASVIGCVSYIPVTFTESEYHVEVFEDLTDSKDKLYLKTNDWMIRTFNSAESVIQHQDKQDGVIIGKYLMGGKLQSSGYATADSRVYAIIDIRIKDQKARIEIKPIGPWKYDSGGMTIFDYSKQDAIAEMKVLAKSLHEALLKQGVEF